MQQGAKGMNTTKLLTTLVLLGTAVLRTALATPTISLDQTTTSLPAASNGLYRVGELVQFEVTASNRGDDATGVVVNYDWPEGLQFVDAVSADSAAVQWESGDRLAWHIGDLSGADSVARLTVSGLVAAGAEGRRLSGKVSVGAMDQPAKVHTLVSAGVSVQSLSTVNLGVTSASTFTQGGGSFNVVFDVTVTNAGPELATDVFLQVTIDPVTFDAIEDGGFSPPAGVICDDAVLSCLLGDMAPNTSVDIRVSGRVLFDSAPINIPIQLDVLSSDTDTDLNDNTLFPSVSLPEVGGGDGGGGGAVGTYLLVLLLLTSVTVHRRRR